MSMTSGRIRTVAALAVTIALCVGAQDALAKGKRGKNKKKRKAAPVELLVAPLDWQRRPVMAAAVRLTIAGIGMLLLLGVLGVSGLPAAFGAIAFIGSGSMTIPVSQRSNSTYCPRTVISPVTKSATADTPGPNWALIAVATAPAISPTESFWAS